MVEPDLAVLVVGISVLAEEVHLPRNHVLLAVEAENFAVVRRQHHRLAILEHRRYAYIGVKVLSTIAEVEVCYLFCLRVEVVEPVFVALYPEFLLAIDIQIL